MFDKFFKKNDEKREKTVKLPKELDTAYSALKKYLIGKEFIALPEIQAIVGVTYPHARQLLAKLREDQIVYGDAIGLKFAVNSLFLSAKELGRNEAVYIRAILDDSDINVLKAFKNGTDADEISRALYATMINEGIISEMCEKLYLNYDVKSIEMLSELKLTDDDWFVEKVVSEIAAVALKSGGEVERQLPKLRAVSDDIKDLALARIIECRKSRTEAKPIRKNLVSERLKYRFIEKIIREFDFDTTEEYVRIIREDMTLLRRSGLYSSELYLALRLAKEELETLTIKAIKEIKNMIED